MPTYHVCEPGVSFREGSTDQVVKAANPREAAAVYAVRVQGLHHTVPGSPLKVYDKAGTEVAVEAVPPWLTPSLAKSLKETFLVEVRVETNPYGDGTPPE